MKKNVFISIIIFLIIAIVAILIIMNKIEDNNIQKQNNIVIQQNKYEKIEKVKSASAYFTVQSCVNKYINYVGNKDTNSLLKLLDSKYIEDNNVTKDNVLEKVENIDGLVIFEAKEMYVKEVDENNKIYYVSGILKEEGLERYITIDTDFDITVNMNFSNNIFSVIPFGNGGLFNEEGN